MNNNDIKAALAALSETMLLLEEEYMENGGEVTEYTATMEANIARLKILLTTEGVDSLGRWLKSQEDRIKTLKAERDSINRQMKSCENTIEYIKTMVNRVLGMTDQDKVKGTLYSFTATTSETTSADKEILNTTFFEAVEKKLRGGKKPVIPEDVTFTLGASISRVPEDAEIPAYYIHSSKPSARFTKPRASKEVANGKDS
ncbi:MAG: siphovirus Gp157 family protein [Bacteroidales bacterium]|nr:siphovirus Gp157 family protein [Bacteroidales bacterium]